MRCYSPKTLRCFSLIALAIIIGLLCPSFLLTEHSNSSNSDSDLNGNSLNALVNEVRANSLDDQPLQCLDGNVAQNELPNHCNLKIMANTVNDSRRIAQELADWFQKVYIEEAVRSHFKSGCSKIKVKLVKFCRKSFQILSKSLDTHL